MFEPFHIVVMLLILADFTFGKQHKEQPEKPKTEEVSEEIKEKSDV